MQNLPAVKYHYWISAFIGVAFLAILQTIANNKVNDSEFLEWIVVFSFWVLGLCTAVFFYNKKYLRLLNQYSVWKALRIPLLILSGSLAFLAAPTPFIRGIFLLLSIVVVALFESTIASYSENMLLNEALFSAFGFFLGFGAWSYLYTPRHRFFVSMLAFAAIFLLSRCFFEYSPAGEKAKLVSSLSVSLLVSELFWVAGFLPQHFSVLAVALTATYYCVSVINFHFLFSNLDFKKIQFHLFFAAVCVILTFISTPWGIIN